MIFHRFSILFVYLPAVHEILPHDVGRGGDGGDGVEERLGHPHGENRVLLPEGLPPGGGIAEPAPDAPADGELDEADDQRCQSEPHLDRPRDIVQVDDEGRGTADGDDQSRKPHVERNLPVGPHPPGESGHNEPAALSGGERHDQERCDAGEDLPEGADPGAGESEDSGRRQCDRHVAQQAVGRHRDDVGPEHAGDNDGGHGYGREDADHGALRHRDVERQQGEIDRGARCDLKEQQPQVKHRKTHFAGLDAAESDEKHQKDERRRNHPPRPLLQRRDGTAQQGADDHSRGHGDAFQIAMKGFGQVHVTYF